MELLGLDAIDEEMGSVDKSGLCATDSSKISESDRTLLTTSARIPWLTVTDFTFFFSIHSSVQDKQFNFTVYYFNYVQIFVNFTN